MPPAPKNESHAAGKAAESSREYLAITCPPLTLTEAGRRLTGYEAGTEHFVVTTPDMSDDIDWPLERDVDCVETPVRIYAIEGHATKIVVPEVYAAELDAVRRLRLGEEGALAGLDPDLLYRALPEDFVAPLDSLPSSRPIERLILLNEPDPFDPWRRKAFRDPFFTTQAAAGRNGVMFFRKDRDPYIGHELRHEWAHLLSEEMPLERVWFDLAATHEGKTYVPRDRALDDAAERYAVLMGEEMLSPDPARFLELTRQAPLQSVLLADELRQYLVDQRNGEDRPIANEVLARVAHVEETVLPRMLERLVADVRDQPDGSFGTEAKRLLVGLEKGHLLNALPNVTSLDLSGLPVGAWRLEWLAENRRIETLDLERTFVGGWVGMRFLRNLPLRTLCLAGTDAKSSLSDFTSIGTLEDVDLSYARIDDSRITGLARMKGLRRLDLRGNVISEKAVAWLRARMPSTEILFEDEGPDGYVSPERHGQRATAPRPAFGGLHPHRRADQVPPERPCNQRGRGFRGEA